MRKLQNMINKLSKRTKLVLGTLTALAVIAAPAAVMAGYGPNGGDRTIFDFSNPEQREGAFDAPRFNSYINTNVYGDERAFLDAKECVTNGAECYSHGVEGGYTDNQEVTAGKEYIVRAYVHNIANPSINDNPATPAPNDGIGVAKNTRIRFELPSGVANGFTAQARISADNSIPKMVYDTVDFKNDSKSYSIDYVPGSAYIFNASHSDGFKLSDSIVGSDGTLLGDDVMNGIYPGCFEYSAFVVIRVKVSSPDLEIEKLASKVEMPKMSETAESVSVKRGEKVSWRINYKNSGTDVAQNIVIRDELPAGLTVVPGSINLVTAAGTETLQDTALGSGGVDVGDYFPEGNGVIRFTTVVDPEPGICELTNIAFARGQELTEKSDTAKVVIEDCAPPVVVCDSLVASRRLVKPGESIVFTANATAQNTTISGYTFSVNGTEVQTSSSNKYTMVQNAEGKYTVAVTVNSPAGNVTSENCVKEVEVIAEKTVVCDSLTATTLTLKIGDKSVLSAKATAKNTSIDGYIFTVNGATVQDSAKNTYLFTAEKVGSYDIAVTVKSPIGNVTSPSCVQTLDVEEEIVPIYRCESLTLSKKNILVGEQVTVTLRITAKDGATFKTATVSFGDEESASDNLVTNNINNNIVTVNHIYKKEGKYVVRGSIEFDVNGEKKIVDDAKCSDAVVVNTPETPPTPEIPNTGAGSVAGLFSAVTAFGAVAHRRFTLKKK